MSAVDAGGPARLVDDMPGIGFGWIAATPSFMQRTSHAIHSGGGVWFTDPVYDTAMLERACALGPPAGVVQQVDRHPRDCARIADELGVPLYVLPARAPDGAPFEVRPVVVSRVARWHEIALWFPAERLLCVGEAVGGAPYFCAPGQSLGPHPLLRLAHPPRRLVGVPAEHVVCGHGAGLHGPDAGDRLADAIRSSRNRTPRWLLGLAGIGRDRTGAGPDAR
jgi:hypothetical protein